jgi:hypothetical protein
MGEKVTSGRTMKRNHYTLNSNFCSSTKSMEGKEVRDPGGSEGLWRETQGLRPLCPKLHGTCLSIR